MSGIHFLGHDDFIIKQGDKGLVLSLIYESKGLTLVLFYSTECPYCDSLIKIFKQIPQSVNGCQFAMVNVSRNMNLVEKSKNTIAPISYVPDLILYVNGSPYVRYDGPHHLDHIKDFIVDISLKIKKIAFMDLNSMNKTAQYKNHSQENYQNTQYQKSQHQMPPQIQQQQIPSQMQQIPPQMQQEMYPQMQQELSQIQQQNNGIPAYTIGTPLYGERKKEKVCYLNFNSAYVSAST